MSSVKARFNVSAPKPYTDREGNEKKQWINVGRATQWDDGNISIELHAVPVGNWFDGKLMLFPADEQKGEAEKGKQSRRAPAPAPVPADGFEDSSIPF